MDWRWFQLGLISPTTQVRALLPQLKLFSMKELIEKYKLAQAEVSKLRSQLEETPDGYLYFSKLRCWGSISWSTHLNEFTVQELCDEYWGDNGIVDVYTNNTNHNISTYGDVEVLSLDELKDLSKKSVSMSQAITNWISK